MQNLVFILVFLGLSTYSFSQDSTCHCPQFGILLGYNYSMINATTTDWTAQNITNLNDLETTNSSGFSLGIMMQYDFNEFIGVRPQSILVFDDAELFYDFGNASDNRRDKLRPISLHFPVHFVFTHPTSKLQPSMIVGFRYIRDVQEDYRFSSLLNTDKDDYAVDVGIGMAKNFEYFKWRVELGYSHGLNNLLRGTDDIFHNALNTLSKNMFSIRTFYTSL